MNQKYLVESLEIIVHQMLYDGKFCGSTEGRRLNHLLWLLTGKSQSRLVSDTSRTGELVSRTVSLPIDLDNAVSVVAENSGLSRSDLIAAALTALIAEDRLA